MFEAILFDLDGTLVDYIESDVQVLKFLHTLTGSTSNFNDFLNTSVEEIMNFHTKVTEQGIDPLSKDNFRLINTFAKYDIEWQDEFVNIYRKKMIDLCIPYNGVEELLLSIMPKVKTGLITNSYDGNEQRKRIKKAGLRDFFDVIVIAGEIGLYKTKSSYILICS